MQFRLNVTLTEEDYLAFNQFHSLESMAGKKMMNKTRAFFTAAMVVLAALVILISGWTTFSVLYTAQIGLVVLFYVLLSPKVVKWSIKAQIKRLKKAGKLPFDAVSKFEFYEDKLVEITETKRVEQSYKAMERICVVENRYIFLYNSGVGAYIFPIPQIREQLSQDDFVRFLASKCSTVENY